MKKLSYLFIALTLITSISIVSCNKVKDLLEITLRDVTFDVDVDATELTTKDGSYDFGGSGTISPRSNADLNPYLSLIRSVDITEVKVTVTSVNPSDLNLLGATFSITDNDNGAVFTYTVTTSTPLSGATFIIDSSTPNFSIVSDIINDLHDATVSLTGSVDQPGFTIGFNYSVKADIVVGVPQTK